MIARDTLLGVLLAALPFTAGAGPTRPWTAVIHVPRGANLAAINRTLDAAPPGATVIVPPGVYRGHLVLSKRIRLVGRGRPLFVATTDESVIRIQAANVTVEGIDIDGEGRGDLGRDSSGLHIAASDAVVRSCSIRGTLFGVYLREADGAVVEHCTILGIPDRDPGEKGSGIHVWNTRGFRLIGNQIAGVRDGIYVQAASHGMILGNAVRDVRYGLHYMFSDDNFFEGNVFADADAGTVIMYSNRVTFRRNRFVHNRGFASVGLLLKSCEDAVAEENLIADNARGIFLEGSYRNVIRRNIIAQSDTAIVLFDSCADNRFEGNSFVANMTPLTLVGRRTDTEFEGNYWAENDEPDLDGDGRSDRPYRLSSVFDHFRGNVAAADLFAGGPAALALAAAETSFPILDPIPVEDRAPLARPPQLAGVPRPAPDRRARPAGIAVSGAMVCLAAGLLFGRGRRRAPRRDGR